MIISLIFNLFFDFTEKITMIKQKFSYFINCGKILIDTYAGSNCGE